MTRVLARYGARTEVDGRQVLQLSDGTTIEVVAGIEDSEPGRWKVSFGAYLQALSSEVMQFLFDLCLAGNFIVDGPDVGVVTSEAVMEQHRDGGFALAHTPEELAILLKRGMTTYKKHVERSSRR